MKMYPNMKALLMAVLEGEIPVDCGAPHWAAEIMGITKAAVHQRIHESGSLEAWGTVGGYVLVSHRSIRAAMKKKQAWPSTQGELDGFAT